MRPTSLRSSPCACGTQEPCCLLSTVLARCGAPTLPLKVAFVYDDSGAGQRGMELLDRWTNGCARDIGFSPVLWRLDHVARLLLRCHASDDVIDADIVIVSLSRPERVSSTIRDWLASCLQRKRKDFMTALTLFDHGGTNGAVMLQCGNALEDVAAPRLDAELSRRRWN